MNIEDKFNLIKTKQSRNRLIMAPMDTVASDTTGMVNDFHIQHYGSRMYGGVGTIILEATAVAENGKITTKDLGIWSDAHIEGLQRITKMAKASNVVIGIQLNHAGARSAGDFNKIAPGIKIFGDSIDKNVKLMNENDFKMIENHFVNAAQRAKKAGFDFVEIHAAHSYLLNQILHPQINEVCTDDDITKRAEIIINIAKRINAEVQIPMGIRFSITDHENDGIRPIHFKPLIDKIDDYMSYFHISSSSLSPKNYVDEDVAKYGKVFRIPYALEVKQMTNKNIIVVGNIQNREDALQVINNGIDGIVLGREILLNPALPLSTILDTNKLDLQDYPWSEAPWYSPLEYVKSKNNVK